MLCLFTVIQSFFATNSMPLRPAILVNDIFNFVCPQYTSLSTNFTRSLYSYIVFTLARNHFVIHHIVVPIPLTSPGTCWRHSEPTTITVTKVIPATTIVYLSSVIPLDSKSMVHIYSEVIQ